MEYTCKNAVQIKNECAEENVPECNPNVRCKRKPFPNVRCLRGMKVSQHVD